MSGQGKADARRVCEILIQEAIDCVMSSPYERAVQTVQELAAERGQEILLLEDLRERRIGDFPDGTFTEAKQRVFGDFRFSYPNGESNCTAQERAVDVLLAILKDYRGQGIVIGTHGDIMTLMMNYFDDSYGFDFWKSTTMPDIYRLEFDEAALLTVTRMWS
ncbi:histidine phosphatase family protein [Paenibacillus profundus]|uniref:histidine phosphatase family protein n=1 Tax=Paenibacillus profundus TaxID=1173085 RepID=UPI002D8083B4|nr:histidine phosphatase family protein [Paenibacillus profundus]